MAPTKPWRSMSPSALAGWFDGKLVSDMIEDEEALRFMDWLFPEKGSVRYYALYESAVAADEPTLYHVPDDWAGGRPERLFDLLDRALTHWRAGTPS